MQSNQKKKIGLFSLIILGVTLPLALSYVYLKLFQSGVDLGARNNGALFETTITTKDLKMNWLNRDKKKPKWILFQIFDDSCNLPCSDRVQLLGNIVAALGDKSDRFRAIMALDSSSLNRFKLLNKPTNLSSLFHPNGAENNIKRKEINLYISEQFIRDSFEIQQITERLNNTFSTQKSAMKLFVIDPAGRFVLGYDDNISPKAIIKDLEILLNASLIG